MRIVLGTLLAVAAVGFGFVSAPASLLVGALPLLLAFLLSWARLAVDLVDGLAAELIADLAVPLVAVVGFWRVTTGSTWLVAALFAAAAAVQALPKIARVGSPFRRARSARP